MAQTTTMQDFHTDSRDGRREHIRLLSSLLEHEAASYEVFGFVKQAIEKIEARDYVAAHDLLRNIRTGEMKSDDVEKLEFVKQALLDMQDNKKMKEQKRRG